MFQDPGIAPGAFFLRQHTACPDPLLDELRSATHRPGNGRRNRAQVHLPSISSAHFVDRNENSFLFVVQVGNFLHQPRKGNEPDNSRLWRKFRRKGQMSPVRRPSQPGLLAYALKCFQTFRVQPGKHSFRVSLSSYFRRNMYSTHVAAFARVHIIFRQNPSDALFFPGKLQRNGDVALPVVLPWSGGVFVRVPLRTLDESRSGSAASRLARPIPLRSRHRN